MATMGDNSGSCTTDSGSPSSSHASSGEVQTQGLLFMDGNTNITLFS